MKKLNVSIFLSIFLCSSMISLAHASKNSCRFIFESGLNRCYKKLSANNCGGGALNNDCQINGGLVKKKKGAVVDKD